MVDSLELAPCRPSLPSLRRIILVGSQTMILRVAAAVSILFASTAYARTWHILPDESLDAPKIEASSLSPIQAAIDSAAEDDVVLVQPGIYYGAIDFLGKGITVRSSGGPPSTIIDGSHDNSSCVVFRNGESRKSILEGFTIRGGSGSGAFPDSPSSGMGGGILIVESMPSILGNVITDNFASDSPTATGTGGGILVISRSSALGWSPRIAGNEITGNFSRRLGGGIAAIGAVFPLIEDNYIHDNLSGFDGGGIYLWTSKSGSVITRNIIKGNEAMDHGGGIVFSWNQELSELLSGELSWNVISENHADAQSQSGTSGGGVLMSGTSLWLHHNTIVRNAGLLSSSDSGGGLAIVGPDASTIEFNIVALSSSGGVACRNNPEANILHNLFWMNTAEDLDQSCQVSAESNMHLDPLFCASDQGDYSVHSNSPALLYPLGPVGALTTAGCEPVSAKGTTWGRLKNAYH
jgi:parallel beta helix pectate lyase-like protein